MPFRDLLTRADDPTRCCLLFHVRSVTIVVGSTQSIILSVAVCFFAMGALYGNEQNSYASRWFLAFLSGSDLNSDMAKQSDRINNAALRSAARNDSTYIESGPQATNDDGPAGATKRIMTVSSSGCAPNDSNSCNMTRGYRYDTFGLSEELSGRLVTMCVLSLGLLVTLMLMGGALRMRAALLIPYLCVQLVDLCTTLVNWTAALSGSERRRWLNEHSLLLPDSLIRTRLDALSESSLLFLVLLLGSSIILFKLCWLQCVWNCYKFIVRHRVNEVTMNFATGFDELVNTGIGSQRRAPFSVGRISAWRSRLAAAESDTTAGLGGLANADAEDPELAGLMPPKYEDVVPVSGGDCERPPTPNYAPPPYCEPCASNSLVDPVVPTYMPTVPMIRFTTGTSDAVNSNLLESHNTGEAALQPLRNASDSGQLLFTDGNEDFEIGGHSRATPRM